MKTIESNDRSAYFSSGTVMKTALTVFLLLFTGTGIAQIIYSHEEPVLIHAPPEKLNYYGINYLSLILDGRYKPLRDISVYIKTDSTGNFRQYPMSYHDGRWSFRVTKDYMTGDTLSYFFVVEFTDFSILALPEHNPGKQPFRLPVDRE